MTWELLKRGQRRSKGHCNYNARISKNELHKEQQEACCKEWGEASAGKQLGWGSNKKAANVPKTKGITETMLKK